MFRRLTLLVTAFVLTLAVRAEPFTFAAIGCMPYGLPATGPAFERLIDTINRHAPAFTVHCGDIKGGSEPTTLEWLDAIAGYFDRFEGPLIFTPGDNEWTDVHRPAAGGHDPLVWLEKLRRRFFAEERSIGQTPLPLVTQRRDPQFAKFVENARWERAGVIFATVHVVGSNNNDQPQVPGAVEEFRERDAANAAWIRETFALARENDAPAVALFFQAAPFAQDFGRSGRDSGFRLFLDTVEAEARSFGRPVLLVHADEHRYRLDVGMRFERDGEVVPNVIRLETFGAGDFHGVLVTVDPRHPQVFLPGPLIAPGNRLPRVWTLGPSR
jgi:hypothetical protein